MYEEEHSDVLSMRSVKSSNAVFQQYKNLRLILSMTSSVRLIPIMLWRGDMTTQVQVERQNKNVISLISATTFANQ